MSVKEFYRNTMTATDMISELNTKIAEVIKSYDPQSVLEFGAGLGKNLSLLKEMGIHNIRGLEVNPGAVSAAIRGGKNVGLGDESTLLLISRYDVVFTCSVLCHIPEIGQIVAQFKRIARKAIVIGETNENADWRYHPHDYESHGFQKLDFDWYSPYNKRRYHIWVLAL